jgi:hypothetical protein
MKTLLIIVGSALAVAALPAAAGFAGNTALSRQVDVHTGPTAGPVHESGHRGDDRRAPRPGPSADDRRHDANDDDGARTPPPQRTPEPGDDKGGLRPRDQSTQAGADRTPDGSTPASGAPDGSTPAGSAPAPSVSDGRQGRGASSGGARHR